MIPVARIVMGQEEKDAVMAVMESGVLAQGPQTAALEQEFAAYVGARHCVAVSNGTAALQLALLSHNIGPGDEVITTAFSFVATASSILMVGATPVFVDIDEDDFNLSPSRIEEAITPRTKAILPVHLYGQPCSLDEIRGNAAAHGLVVIEDAAQAAGAAFEGTPIGGTGTATFSLYATKNFTSGEGGLVATDDDDVADRLRLLRNHGMRVRYYHDMLGYNLRLSDLHAAIGRVQLSRLPGYNERRDQVARAYGQGLKGLRLPATRAGCRHAWHQFTIVLPEGLDRDAFLKHLSERGVGAAVFYPVPLHRQQFIRDKIGDVSLPLTEALSASVVSLPMNAHLSDADIEQVISAVNSFVG